MRNVRSEVLRLGSLLALLALVACGRPAAPTAAPPDLAPRALSASDLFISEYVEGSGVNKALEIYNGTGASIDLSAGEYVVQIYSNGSDSAGFTMSLAGTLEDGDVFVLAQSGADQAVLDVADATTGAGLFNGDDVVVLRKGTTVLDVIGQIGVATTWGDGGTSTQNHTLRRQESVCVGDVDGSDAFDPGLEWDGFPQDTFDGLGSHDGCGSGEGGGDGGGGDGEAPGILLNEIRIDQPSGDVDEFFELVGPAGASLDGLVHLVVGDGSSGDSGVIESVVDLSGNVVPDDGYFVVAEDTFTLGEADLTATLGFENGDNVTHLLVSGFTGANEDDLDVDDDGTLDATPWEAELDRVALVEEANPPSDTVFHYGPPSVGPDGSFVPGHVQRCGDTWTIGEFGGGTDTPGAANVCGDGGGGEEPVAIGQCGEDATLVSAVQGDGAASPLQDQAVVVEGIVVGDFQADDGDAFDTDLGGFYLQEEEADWDGDDATSEGVFVYAPDAVDVAAGQVVRVAGTVTEFDGLTELTDAEILDCGTTAEPVVTEITLPVEPRDALERYEGMLVRFPQELVIAEYFNFDRFGEIVLALPMDGSDRPFQPTSYVEPGPEAAELAEEIALRSITLDDARSTQNPASARHPNGGEFTLDNRFRGGDLVADATGILDDRHDAYRIQPTEGAAYTSVNERPAEPTDVGGELRAASFNVLNYFSTLDTGAEICGPEGTLECRGADTLEEFERQRDKIIAALATIDADIVGLIEIENATAALNDLVQGLNDEVGAGTYAAVTTGPIGTDAIRVALVYKPGTVTPVGEPAVLDDPAFVDPAGTGQERNRPAVAQTFEAVEDGERLTVVVNHLKSKGSSCGEGDDDPLQGNCNLTRTLAAEALLDWIASDPTGAGDPDYLLLGDYNAYDEEDPIDVLLAGGFVDLLEEHEGEFAYSYVFDGQFGHLDYAFASDALAPQVTGATAWRINADEPDVLDYDTSFKPAAQAEALYEPTPYRSSDHDPIVVGLDLASTTVCEAAEASPATLWPANHAFVEVRIVGADGEPLPVTIDAVHQDEPVVGRGSGRTAPDAVVHEGGRLELRAEREGGGDGRVYHVAFTGPDGCSGEVVVSVPKSRGRGGAAADGGALYDSTVR